MYVCTILSDKNYIHFRISCNINKYTEIDQLELGVAYKSLSGLFSSIQNKTKKGILSS